jgi:glycosyltransferase involved in cell wall biosynthesis
MTHNDAAHIAETIRSVQKQTFPGWEMVICDDASTDGTECAIRPFLMDERIRYVRHERNRGQGRNWAFALAQGGAPIVSVLHGDDYWLPDTLEAALREFESDQEIDAVYGNWTRITDGQIEKHPAKPEEDHLYTGTQELEYQIRHNTMLCSFVLLRRSLAERVGDPDPDLAAVVDTVWFLKMSSRARRVRALPVLFGYYRQHSANATNVLRRSGVLLDEIARMPEIMRPFYGQLEGGHRLDRLQRKWSAEQLFTAGVNRALEGDFAAANSLMKRGMRVSPAVLKRPIRLIDFVLTRLGPLSRPIIGQLHRGRARRVEVEV